MGQQEGIDLLLKSVEYIVKEKKREDIRFCIMGSGPALEELRTLNKH
jgi:glycosyltransferase involved in cell wall biosynthesis